MALIRDDRVAETTTSIGTSALTLAAAITGYRRFSSAMSVGDTCYYTVEAIDTNGVPTGEFETGLGTYSAANELTRTTVSRSSNANAAVNFAAGTKRVILTAIATDLATLNVTKDYASHVITPATRTTTFNGPTAVPSWLTIKPGGAMAVIADATDPGVTHVLTFGADGSSRGNNADEWCEFTAVSDGAANNTLTVRYRTNGEANYDGVRVMLNGVQQMQNLSGDSGWTTYTLVLAAGTHLIRLRYNSDFSNTSGFQNVRFALLGVPIQSVPNYLHGDSVVSGGVRFMCIKAGTQVAPAASATSDWKRLDGIPVLGTATGPSGGTGVPTARYWRIQSLTEIGHEHYISLSNIEFREVIGVAQQATGGTPFGSPDIGGWPIANAFDANNNTTYISNASLPSVAGYDFVTPKAIRQVALRSRHDGYQYQAPKDFNVQRSDNNIDWVTEWSVVGSGFTTNTTIQLTFDNPNAGTAESQAYPTTMHALNDVDLSTPINGQYLRYDGVTRQWSSAFPPSSNPPVVSTKWRVNVLSSINNNGAWMGVFDLEMRATPGGPDQTTGGTATAQLTNGGNVAANAFDASMDTQWQAGGGTLPVWLQYEFLTPVEVNEIAWTGSTNPLDNPGSFDVQYWDGAAWITHYRVTGISAWTAKQTKLFANPVPTTAQHYRVGWFFTSVLEASEVVVVHAFTRAVTFRPNWGLAVAVVDGTMPDAAMVLDIRKNGVSVGTISISTAGVATFTSTGGNAVTFAVGDRMKLVGPATQRAATDVSGTFEGYF